MALEKLKAGETKPKSKYKGVYLQLSPTNYISWATSLMVKGKAEKSTHQTEIEAAKRYDMYLIRAGKEPVNILKRK